MSARWSVGCGHLDTLLAGKAEIKVQVTKAPLNLIERLWRRSSQHQIWVRRQGMHPSTIRDPYLGPYHLTTQRLLPKKCKKLLQFTSNFAILGVKEESI